MLLASCPLSASATFVAYSMAFLLSTGFDPGMPRQISHVRELGMSLGAVAQPQKSLLCVLSWQWISSPMSVLVALFICVSCLEDLLFFEVVADEHHADGHAFAHAAGNAHVGESCKVGSDSELVKHIVL